MLSFLPKCLLVATSLSPVLGVVAFSQIDQGLPWNQWIRWLVAALLLIALCWLMLQYADKNAELQSLYIQEYQRTDSGMLTFLFIYMLPFVRSETVVFSVGSLATIYILVVIICAIAYADAFHFNPVMRILGYRFYAIKNRSGISQLLISKKDLRRASIEVQTVRIARNVHLHKRDPNA